MVLEKTTLLRMMSGVLPIESGNVTANGAILSSQELRRRVGFMPEHVRWSGHESVEQTLVEFALLRGCSKDSALEGPWRHWPKEQSIIPLGFIEPRHEATAFAWYCIALEHRMFSSSMNRSMDWILFAIDAFKRLLSVTRSKRNRDCDIEPPFIRIRPTHRHPCFTSPWPVSRPWNNGFYSRKIRF